MREIPLTKGLVALVDDADYAWLSQWKWSSSSTGYARRVVQKDNKQTQIKMHRLIMGAEQGLEVDHLNGNGLDNQRANLRVVTHAQNQQNRHGPTRSSLTGMRGVTWHRRARKYMAMVTVHGRANYLGLFTSLSEAGAAAAQARARLMTHSTN